MIQIQMWGDFECPYSYFQTIVLEKLKDKHQDNIEIVWRAFELSPIEGKITPSQSYLHNLEAAKSEAIIKSEGLTLCTPKFLTYTWLAQECVCFANAQGRSLALARALFNAFFIHRLDISDEKVVIGIATQIGLDESLLRLALENGSTTKLVLDDEQEFKTYGFQGLPAMLIGEKNFSPKSFMPITGYKSLDEMTDLLPKI